MFPRRGDLLLQQSAAAGMIVLVCVFAHVRVFGQISTTDDLKRTVTLASKPARIVSLAPSITETLFAVGAGDQVVGVTNYCNYPPEAKKKTRVGGIINPNIESIIGLKPDLIVLTMEGNVREDFAKLTGLGVPVFVTNPRSLGSIYKSIRDLGALTWHSAEAESLVHAMQARERAITASMRPRVERSLLLLVSLQPLMVVGSGTYLTELIHLAGARNPASSSPSTYPQFSREAVLEEDPDVLLVMSDVCSTITQLTDLYPEWTRLKAFRTGRVYRVDADLLARPGPRAIDALELLDRLIHSHGG